MNPIETAPDPLAEMEANIGKLSFWNSKPFLDAADILVAGDEPLRALELLTNLPGYYRDHVPLEIHEMKREIYSLLATPTFYASNPFDARVLTGDQCIDIFQHTLRGHLIHDDFRQFKEQGKVPHLIDLGPGEYWVPIGLHTLGFAFTYQDIGLCETAQKLAYPQLQGHLGPKSPASPTIFIACELIEHLHHEEDLRVDFERSGGKADILHISTPKYSFDGKPEKFHWRKHGDLGHLRTYTPKEFMETMGRIFPEFSWGIYTQGPILHARGVPQH